MTKQNGRRDEERRGTGNPAPGPASTAARSKAALRDELEQATQRFLRDGGVVSRVPAGASAWSPGTRPPPAKPLFGEPRDERTPVSDVVARIEARRAALKRTRKPARKPRAKRAKRRVIYDDFGEPLRRVWVED